MATPKYRPYFTGPELAEVQRALKLVSLNVELIRYLETFSLKIASGIQEPNITLKPTISERLGMSDRLPSLNLSELKLAAYNKWLDSPQKCTPQEIARTLMFRYENDLMSEEEEREYESKIERGY